MKLDRKTVIERLDAGYSAIDVSLEKWNELKKKWVELSGDEHYRACALCYIAHVRDRASCDKCIIVMSGGKACDDWGSPYRKAIDKKNAQPMIEALEHAKEWLRKEDCTKKSVKQTVTRKLGDRFLHTGCEYILGRLSVNSECWCGLISLASGNMWSGSAQVSSCRAITDDEFAIMTGDESNSFEKIRR